MSKSTKRNEAFAAYRRTYLYRTRNYFKRALGSAFKRKLWF